MVKVTEEEVKEDNKERGEKRGKRSEGQSGNDRL